MADSEEFSTSLQDDQEDTASATNGHISKDIPHHPSNSYENGEEPSVDLDDSSAAAIMSSLKMDDSSLKMSDTHVKDLFIRVDDPEKHVGGYVSYNVITKTTRNQFDHPEYSVRRRYQDFLWLRQRMQESYPTHIIPPLPEKHSFTKHFDRFSPEFLKARELALNKFMTRIADHPVMSFNDHLHVFLTAKSWELTSVKKQGPGLMSRMSDSMRNMASSWMLKSRDPEFQEMTEYTKTFREKMIAMETISDKIAKDRFDLLEHYLEFIPIFRLWANSETKLASPLNAMADALETNVAALKKLLKAQDPMFMEPLREYVLYTDSIRNAMKSRDTVQMEYEVTLEELARKRTEKEELDKPGGGGGGRFGFFSKDNEQTRQDKKEKLETSIVELGKLAETGNDKMECANVDLKADLERWHKHKREDFRDLFMDYADRHTAYYQECLTAWQSVLEQIAGSKDLEEQEEIQE
ncbi:sorting nexin-7-like [Nematostella vectensis]|uniref:sorting nexin-7-like n=1 Tax=Nematostella vectensis TaxID=45351 RepID=UPI0020772D57|nr:sorting nexin-7-like [Nematostella vectensis]